MAEAGTELFNNPEFESVSCQRNCGFVLFYRRGQDDFPILQRMSVHKLRGCRADNKLIDKGED
mgnify:CR=1 FL=1